MDIIKLDMYFGDISKQGFKLWYCRSKIVLGRELIRVVAYGSGSQGRYTEFTVFLYLLTKGIPGGIGAY